MTPFATNDFVARGSKVKMFDSARLVFTISTSLSGEGNIALGIGGNSSTQQSRAVTFAVTGSGRTLSIPRSSPLVQDGLIDAAALAAPNERRIRRFAFLQQLEERALVALRVKPENAGKSEAELRDMARTIAGSRLADFIRANPNRPLPGTSDAPRD